MDYCDGTREEANRQMAAHYGSNDRAGYASSFRPHRQGAAGREPVILVGLDAICGAVGAGQIAVKRWIRDEGFPARRCSDGKYRADPESVRRWFGRERG